MWFNPPERNTLHQRKNRAVLLEPAFFSDRESVFDPREEVSTRSFYSSRPGSYNETRGPTGGPEVVETLYNI
jgi:hypothetical protein